MLSEVTTFTKLSGIRQLEKNYFDEREEAKHFANYAVAIYKTQEQEEL